MVETIKPRPPEIPGVQEGELSEEMMFDLLSSVGNGENQALILMVMREGVVYSRYSHYKELLNHQKKGSE